MTEIHAPFLSAACRTDAGCVRGNNEDLPLCDPDRGVFAVIDGVGGQAAGEVAAAIASSEILARLARPLGTPAERVREAIALANNEIFRQAEEWPTRHGMTCVLTLALVVGRHVTIGHVGDSRLYRLAPDGIKKLTHDHSPVGEREDAREITESEAMRHPRRNEVFRDVGSEYRDKDDQGFVEIVEAALENHHALLLCSDGLTDMVSSSTIEHLVRQHAGDPQAVVDALVAAANDAGGRDNITVVYAEAPGFAPAVRGLLGARSAPKEDSQPAKGSASHGISRARALGWFGSSGPTAPGSDGTRIESASQVAHAAIEGRPADGPREPAGGVVGGWRWIVRRRATWFGCGTVMGVVVALVLAWRLDTVAPPARRTLSVSDSGGQPFSRIADALADARSGDIVQLEPGTYKEQVVLPDGVDLVARLPGKATLMRAEGATGEWRAVTADGASGGRIYGIRIDSSTAAPIDVGLHISGAGRRVELVDIEGPLRAAIELTGATAVTIRGCVVHNAHGPAVTMDASSEAAIANNTFVRTGHAVEPALSLMDATRTVVTRNLFAGYGVEIIRGVSADERAQLLSGNFVVAAEPTIAR